MWIVIGGQGRSTLTRPCQHSKEAEQWAHQLIEAGITPVRINGVPFDPALRDIAQPEPSAAHQQSTR